MKALKLSKQIKKKIKYFKYHIDSVRKSSIVEFFQLLDEECKIGWKYIFDDVTSSSILISRANSALILRL